MHKDLKEFKRRTTKLCNEARQIIVSTQAMLKGELNKSMVETLKMRRADIAIKIKELEAFETDIENLLGTKDFSEDEVTRQQYKEEMENSVNRNEYKEVLKELKEISERIETCEVTTNGEQSSCYGLRPKKLGTTHPLYNKDIGPHPGAGTSRRHRSLSLTPIDRGISPTLEQDDVIIVPEERGTSSKRPERARLLKEIGGRTPAHRKIGHIHSVITANIRAQETPQPEDETEDALRSHLFDEMEKMQDEADTMKETVKHINFAVDKIDKDNKEIKHMIQSMYREKQREAQDSCYDPSYSRRPDENGQRCYSFNDATGRPSFQQTRGPSNDYRNNNQQPFGPQQARNLGPMGNGFYRPRPQYSSESSYEQVIMESKATKMTTQIADTALKLIKPFNGEPEKYAQFIGQFEVMVHRQEIPVQLKHAVLLRLLDDKLTTEFQASEMNDENYFILRENLENQFNKNTNQTNVIIAKMEALDFSKNDLEVLTSSLNTYSTYAGKLKAFGINPDDPYHLAAFVNKLPINIRAPVQKRQMKGGAKLRQLVEEAHNKIALIRGLEQSERIHNQKSRNDEIYIHTMDTEDYEFTPKMVKEKRSDPNHVSNKKLEQQTEQLWRTEVLGMEPPEAVKDKDTLNKELISEFKRSAILDKDNKVYVALPHNGLEEQLHEKSNYPVAEKRLIALLDRELKKPEAREEYNKILQMQEELGIIERVSEETQADGPEYFIPHHVVIKEDSLTTKLRIVLDASSHMKNKLSLNDTLHPGPAILQAILGILLRARLGKHLMVADIEKAFHQVRLQEKYRNVTKFLWLKDPSKGFSKDNILVFRFTRLPFGVTCSPFLLAVTIMLYLDLKPTEINDRILENLYVDNIMFTSNSEEDMERCYKGSKEAFDAMHMNLREYLCNSSVVMKNITEEDRAPKTTCKLLGHIWDSLLDTLTIKIAKPPEGVPTKRQIVSFNAQNYDPSGLISPILVPVKKLISLLWKKDLKWNDKIPQEFVPMWNAVAMLFTENTYSIPRQLVDSYDFKSVQLIMFSDASKDHYATTAYLRFGYEEDKFKTGLIFAKSRIRPSGGTEYTIPRMELMSMEIASNAAVNLAKELHIKIKDVVLFSDSTCVLFWVLNKVNNSSGSKWITNRVKKIRKNFADLQEDEMPTTVRYVPTDQNPADIASRGCSLEELKTRKLWQHGPEFLTQKEDTWPTKLDNTPADPYEFREYAIKLGIIKPLTQAGVAIQIAVNKVSKEDTYESIVPYERSNDMRRLTSIMEKSFRWINILIQKRNKRHPDRQIQYQGETMKKFGDAFRADDAVATLILARNYIIKDHYKDAEVRLNEKLPKYARPVLMEDGLWHHETRYHGAKDEKITPTMKYPIIILAKHRVAKLIVNEAHKKLKHQGVQDVICLICENFWIEKLWTLVKRARAGCATCQKRHGKPYAYLFDRTLPHTRTTMVSPFKHIGLDYFGPLYYKTKEKPGKGKIWVLLVTCLVTRAVHLEVVTDNTTISFIGGLRRFISRRGKPDSILSDNAPHFKLGYRMINYDLRTLINKSETLTSFLAQNEIEVKLITPLSPWHGGSYERLVAIVKNVVYKVLGKMLPTFLELETLIIEVEGIANSRPITPNKKDVDDDGAIRPIDFINTNANLALPEKTDTIFGVIKKGDTEKLTRRYLEQIGRVKEELWYHFTTKYFHALRDFKPRNVAHSRLKPKPGQIVLVETENLQRHKWPLGRIISISRTLKDEPRSVMVRCGKRTVERSINQLIPLEDPGDEEGGSLMPDPNISTRPVFMPPPKYPKKKKVQQAKEIEPPKKRGRPPKSTTTSTPKQLPIQEVPTTTSSSKKEKDTVPEPLLGKDQYTSPRTRPYLPRKAKVNVVQQLEDNTNDNLPFLNFIRKGGSSPPQCRGDTYGLAVSTTSFLQDLHTNPSAN